MLRSHFNFDEILNDNEYYELSKTMINNQSSLMIPRKILPNEQLVNTLRNIYVTNNDDTNNDDNDLIYNYIINNGNIQDKIWEDVSFHILQKREEILEEYLKLNNNFLFVFHQSLIEDYIEKYGEHPPQNHGFENDIREIFNNDEHLKSFFYNYYNVSGFFSDFMCNIMFDNIKFSNADMSFIFCLVCLKSKFNASKENVTQNENS